jgi:hypothetical protein
MTIRICFSDVGEVSSDLFIMRHYDQYLVTQTQMSRNVLTVFPVVQRSDK